MANRERRVDAAVTSSAPPAGREPTRARYPDAKGLLDRDGVRIHWEAYGHGDPAILFLPTWSIIHSRCWKLQIPDFARRHRVVTFDPRGNGRSDRPTDPAVYAEDEFAADAVAVLDELEIEAAVVVALSLGAQRALVLAAEHADRVSGLVLIGPALDLGLPVDPERETAGPFDLDLGDDQGWRRYNAHSWRRDWPGFAEFFFGRVFTEPHSTKQVEDCVGWALGTDPEIMITAEVPGLGETRTRELCGRVRCPVMVVHGDRDAIIPPARGARAAALTGGRLVTMEGSGHCPQARDPVRFNLILREFVAGLGDSTEGTAP